MRAGPRTVSGPNPEGLFGQEGEAEWGLDVKIEFRDFG